MYLEWQYEQLDPLTFIAISGKLVYLSPMTTAAALTGKLDGDPSAD